MRNKAFKAKELQKMCLNLESMNVLGGMYRPELLYSCENC